MLTITGLNMELTSDIHCRVGIIDVPAQFLNSTSVLCIAPAQESVGSYTVEISLNGADFTNDGVFFHYSDPAQVLSIEPATGSIDGGTTVSINGRNFNQSGAHLCRFGDNTPPVPANFVSSSKIVCLSPSNEPGASTVEVSDNGADYTTSFVQFTYLSKQ